jgi:Uma2 family endonuclease
MAILEKLLPRDAVFDLQGDRLGPIRAADFETWAQDEAEPIELIEGWVMPMAPGNVYAGDLLVELAVALKEWSRPRGLRLTFDSRYRLPAPPETVVFPDLAVHRSADLQVEPSGTVVTVPDLVIEVLGSASAHRDQSPRGAKFLAYEMSGVREYFYTWPDGTGAAGFRLVEGGYVQLAPDPAGFFPSQVLGGKLRLLPAAVTG